MMKCILVPIDFTDNTDNLLDYALHLAQKAGSEIRLLHVVDDPFVKEKMPDPPPVMDDGHTEELIYKMQIDAREEMKKVINRFEDKIRLQGQVAVSVSHNIDVGTVEDKILEEAARTQPNLILIGTHEHKRMGRMFFGSVTQALIRRAHFPILAIPENFIYRELKEVVYMTDLRNDDIVSIAKVINLFSHFEPKLHITHFNTEENSEEEKMFELSEQFTNKRNATKIEYEIIDANILRDAYIEYLHVKNIDLIALTTRKTSGFQRFFKPGVAVDVLFHGKLPLLVFHSN